MSNKRGDGASDPSRFLVIRMSYHINSYIFINSFVVCLLMKIALHPSAAPFPSTSSSLPTPLSHFGTSTLNSEPSSLAVPSANLCVHGVSALAFLIPRSSLPANGCRLTADGPPLTPFTTSLTQKQGGTGYWYDQSQNEEAGIKASATGKKEEKREQRKACRVPQSLRVAFCKGGSAGLGVGDGEIEQRLRNSSPKKRGMGRRWLRHGERGLDERRSAGLWSA
jgi:hypothetical protein